MQNKNWKKVKEVLDAALDLDAKERRAFLNDGKIAPQIRAEVESLLVFESAAEDSMNFSAIEFSRDFFDANETKNTLIGQTFGVYTVIGELGCGGMGAVYLAERADGKFSQRVALKLLRREMNTAALRRRFEQERQILASLEHPNIARLLDAGTTDDKIPYIAMEYVEGLPIDDFCNRKNLDLDQRLDLFRKVCAAVNFAHRNLVVHRDLKPSNIMVNGDGMPKLLDFGISKIVSADFEQNDSATVTKLGAMTPGYASPEQLQNKSVSTATDVYSLGVILYELLSGHRPFETKEIDFKEICKAVLENEPPPPSAMLETSSKNFRQITEAKTAIVSGKNSESDTEINRNKPKTLGNKSLHTMPQAVKLDSNSLRGDLDNIVLKALRKEPERRYTSAENLAEDIHLHQRGLPVSARPNTFSYRAEKFIKRNTASVVAVAFILLAILGGIIATLWQARVAQAERAKAEKRFNDVRTLANSFLFEFSPKIENLPGSTPARELLVVRALEYLDNLVKEAGDDLELQRELAAAYEKVGDVQGNPNNPNLGDLKGGLESYEKALNIQQNLLETQPDDVTTQINLARNLGNIGEIQGKTGEKAKGLETQEKALQISRQIVERNPQNFEARENLAAIIRSRGMIDFWTGKNSQAVEHFNQSKELYERLLNEKPDNPPMIRAFAGLYMNIGEAQAWDDDFENAEKNIQKGLEMTIPLAEKYPYNNSMQRALMIAYLKRATNFQMEEDNEKAAPMFAKGLEIARKLSEADPQNLQAKKDVAQLGAYLGSSLDLSGKSVEALKIFEFAVEKSAEIRDTHPNDLNAAYNVASTRFAYGETYETLKDYESALKIFETVRDELQSVLERDPNYGNAIRDDAFIYDHIGKSYAHLAEKGNRREFLQKALENQRAALEKFNKMKKDRKLSQFDLKEVEQTEKEIEQLEIETGK